MTHSMAVNALQKLFVVPRELKIADNVPSVNADRIRVICGLGRTSKHIDHHENDHHDQVWWYEAGFVSMFI